MSLEPADDVAALAGLVRGLTRGNATDQLDALLERAEAGDGPVSAGDIERALAGADSSEDRTSGEVVSRNPYKGLRAFTVADSRDFFGREAMAESLVAKLAAPGPDGRFIAVIGPSGSGKSSLVRAGLLPRLTAGAIQGSDTWFAAEMLPGAHPVEELEAALVRIAVSPVSRLLERLESGSRADSSRRST